MADNLESLAYILIYFLCGCLPWQDLPSGSWSILKCKQQTKPSNLCCGLLVEFTTFLKYSCLLSFEEILNYGYITDLFKGLSLWDGLESVMLMDWDHAESADEQLWDLVNNCIGQHKHNEPLKHHQGYVMFLLWTSYILMSSCV
jgi:hypothetical protein